MESIVERIQYWFSLVNVTYNVRVWGALSKEEEAGCVGVSVQGGLREPRGCWRQEEEGKGRSNTRVAPRTTPLQSTYLFKTQRAIFETQPHRLVQHKYNIYTTTTHPHTHFLSDRSHSKRSTSTRNNKHISIATNTRSNNDIFSKEEQQTHSYSQQPTKRLRKKHQGEVGALRKASTEGAATTETPKQLQIVLPIPLHQKRHTTRYVKHISNIYDQLIRLCF